MVAPNNASPSNQAAVVETLIRCAYYMVAAGAISALAWLYHHPNLSSPILIGAQNLMKSIAALNWFCVGSQHRAAVKCSTNNLASPTSATVVTSLPAKKDTPKLAGRQRTSFMVVCFLGLQVSYVSWGYFQERIITQDYGDGDRFKNAEWLVLLNRLSAVMVAAVIQVWRQDPSAPPYKYSLASVSNCMSSWLQYEALKFVSFPFQVLSKSSKVPAAMLMGTVLSGQRYPKRDYLVASMITLGLFIFQMAPSDSKGHGHGGSSSSFAQIFGISLLAGYVVFDSFTSTWQSQVFKEHKVSPYQMMFAVNVWSSCLVLCSMLVQNTFFSSFNFTMAHPLFMLHSGLMSLCSAVGQLFIFNTIEQFGAVVFAGFMTARQFISFLTSIMLFGHPLSTGGYLGMALVFGAMVMQLQGGGGGKGRGDGGKAPQNNNNNNNNNNLEKIVLESRGGDNNSNGREEREDSRNSNKSQEVDDERADKEPFLSTSTRPGKSRSPRQ